MINFTRVRAPQNFNVYIKLNNKVQNRATLDLCLRNLLRSGLPWTLQGEKASGKPLDSLANDWKKGFPSNL